jgi:hypothetical protein
MLPMPTDVIDRVNKFSRRDLNTRETLMFADQDQLDIPDEFVNDSDSDDESYHPVEEEDIDNDVSYTDEGVGDDAAMDPVENFEIISNASDGIALLNAIKNAAYNYDAVMDPVEFPADALVEDDNGNALDGMTSM